MSIATKQEFLVVDAYELEDLIINNFANCDDFSVHADLEANGGMERFDKIDGVLDQFETGHMLSFIKTGKGNYVLRTILEYLCWTEVIPPGDYLVDCS